MLQHHFYALYCVFFTVQHGIRGRITSVNVLKYDPGLVVEMDLLLLLARMMTIVLHLYQSTFICSFYACMCTCKICLSAMNVEKSFKIVSKDDILISFTFCCNFMQTIISLVRRVWQCCNVFQCS